MNVKIALVALALCVCGACSSVDVTKTSKDFYNPTDPNDIEILRTEPKEEFEELGTFNVSGFGQSDTASMHNAIRSEAAKIGGHAALIQDKGMTPTGFGAYDQWCSGVVLRFQNQRR